MAIVSVAAVQVTGLAVRLSVSLSGVLPGTTMTVVRVNGAVESPVLGATDVPAADNVFDDPEVDLNASVFWRVTLSTGETATSPLLFIANTFPVLSDPYSGRWVEVAIVDMGDPSAAQRGKAIDIEETAEVVYVYDVESAPRSQLVLLTRTREDRVAFDELMRPGGPLLLRASCPDHQVGWWARDGGTRDTTSIVKGGMSEARVHTFTSTVRVPVPRPDTRPIGDTLQDLHLVTPVNLSQIEATWSTLGAIAAADLRSL